MASETGKDAKAPATAAAAVATPLTAADLVVSTLAGGSGAGFRDDTGAKAQFASPCGVAYDALTKTLAVADYKNHRIRLVDVTTGAVTTLCGSGVAGYRDGAGADAQFNRPRGVAFDRSARTTGGNASAGGSLLIADQFNAAIRRVDLTTRQVTTVAGTGAAGTADGPAAAATFAMPFDVAVHPLTGDVFVADNDSHRVRRIAFAAAPAAATVTVAASAPAAAAAGAGAGAGATSAGAAGAVAAGAGAAAPAPAGAGIADSKADAKAAPAGATAGAAAAAAVIVRSEGDASAVVSTVAGSGDADHHDAPKGADAKLDTPRYLALDVSTTSTSSGAGAAAADALYVTTENAVRRIDLRAPYAVTTAAKSDRLNPFGLAFNPATRHVLWTDFMLHTVSCKPVGAPGAAPGGAAGTQRLAGNGQSGAAVAGPVAAAKARFDWPEGMAVDSATGTFWVADSGNHCVRAFSLAAPSAAK